MCPSCHRKRELLWADWAEQELLEDVPHRQVVFTIPKRLRIFFRYDRKLLGELAACAWRALKLYFAAYFDAADVTPGAIGFLQTAGELLNFHPHVHLLVTDGGFAPDGTFRPLAWFHSQHVERLFRAEVLRMLLGKKLITETVVDNLLSWRHSGFSAHGAVRVEDRQGAVRLGRYMIRCPIVLKRLSWQTDSGEVGYRGRPSRRTGRHPSVARWDVLEFLARVVDHIPEPSQQTVRYWGFYANAARGKRRKAAQGGDAEQTPRRQDDDELTRRARLSWAKLIHRVYEVDPLLCPFCGADEDPRLHPRLRRCPRPPQESRAPGPGARAAGPRTSRSSRIHRRLRLNLGPSVLWLLHLGGSVGAPTGLAGTRAFESLHPASPATLKTAPPAAGP